MQSIALDEVNLWLTGGIGFAAGLLGSMLGIGGGFFMVPLLTLALRLPIHIAIASSLVAIVVTSSTAAITYTKAGLTNIKLGMLLETVTVPGAIIGALVAVILAPTILSITFGVVLIYAAYSMIASRPRVADAILLKGNVAETDDAYIDILSRHEDCQCKRNISQITGCTINHVPQGLAASFMAGIFSGLLGIGGGTIKVPAMTLIMKLPIKIAIATSSFMVGITATAGALIYFYHGYIYPIIVAPLIIGAFLGAKLGSELTQRATGTLLRYTFAAVISIIAVLMLLQCTIQSQ